jgi:O-antigen/teichoic acid export membrane protein
LPRPSNSVIGLLLSNAVWNLARYTVNWAVLLVVPPFLIRHLSTPEYATWMLLLQFSTYYTMLDMNLQLGVSRFVARSAARADRIDLGITISSIAATLTVLGVAILGLGLVATVFLDQIFPAIPSMLMPRARVSALILISSLGMVLPFSTLAGAFLGFQRNRVVTLAIVLSRVASGVAMIVAVRQGGSLVSLACCYAGATLFVPLIYTAAWLRSDERVPARIAAVRRSMVVSFTTYSASLGLIALSSILVSGLSLPIVGIYAFSDVTRYSLAMVLGNMLLIPQSAILMVLLPTLSMRSLDNDPAAMGQLLLRFARISSLPLTVFTAGLLISAPLFLKVWIGPALAVQVLGPAALLVLAAFVGLTAHPYRLATLGAGQQLATVPATLLEGAISVGLSIVLVQRLGATGVALAALVAAIFGLIAQLTVSMPRTPAIQVSRRSYFMAALVRPALAVLPAMILLALLWNKSISVMAWIPIIAAAAGAAALIAIATSFDRTDQEKAFAMATAMLRRLRTGRHPEV